MLHCTFWLVLTVGAALRNCHLTSCEVTTLPSFRIVEQESVRLKKKTRFFFFWLSFSHFCQRNPMHNFKVQCVKILSHPGILTACLAFRPMPDRLLSKMVQDGCWQGRRPLLLRLHSHIYENDSKGRKTKTTLSAIYIGNMLSFYQYKTHTSSQILHSGPLIEKVCSVCNSETSK